MVLDDDHPAGVVRSGEDDFAGASGQNARSGGFGPIEPVPVLGGMPIAGVVPGVFGLEPVADEKPVAGHTLRFGNREAEAVPGLRSRRPNRAQGEGPGSEAAEQPSAIECGIHLVGLRNSPMPAVVIRPANGGTCAGSRVNRASL